MNRRKFLKLSSFSTGSVLAGSSALAFQASCSKNNMDMNMPPGDVMVEEGAFNRLLPVPPEVAGTTSLSAQNTTANLGGNNIPVLGYTANGILGPTIRVNQGDVVNISFQNALSEISNIHWHGLKIPASMDGHPESIVDVGGSFAFQFTVNQRSGLSWYHPHADGTTAKHANGGLAGFFIINDAEEVSLKQPSGNYEWPLVIQDKKLTASGITYDPDEEEVMTGYMGETMMVNGVASPFMEVESRYYRLRILNGSNTRIYNLALSNMQH